MTRTTLIEWPCWNWKISLQHNHSYTVTKGPGTIVPFFHLKSEHDIKVCRGGFVSVLQSLYTNVKRQFVKKYHCSMRCVTFTANMQQTEITHLLFKLRSNYHRYYRPEIPGLLLTFCITMSSTNEALNGIFKSLLKTLAQKWTLTKYLHIGPQIWAVTHIALKRVFKILLSLPEDAGDSDIWYGCFDHGKKKTLNLCLMQGKTGGCSRTSGLYFLNFTGISQVYIFEILPSLVFWSMRVNGTPSHTYNGLECDFQHT